AVLCLTIPVDGFSAFGSVHRSIRNGLAFVPAIAREDERWKTTYERLTQPCLLPALRSYVRARDLCPLIAKPHVRIAAYHELFQRADSRAAYLERAIRLVPHDAELWYLSGNQAEREGRLDEACRCWRRSLEQ